jgi:hypothetical protein
MQAGGLLPWATPLVEPWTIVVGRPWVGGAAIILTGSFSVIFQARAPPLA